MIKATNPFFPALLAITAPAIAGPLSPPTGPITSTAKPLSDVEPRIAINAQNTPGDSDSVFKIRQSGSYYLTGDVNGSMGKGGIEVVASAVTIDLAGFSLTGGYGSQQGIFTSVGAVASIEVRDGFVRNWGGDGINVPSPTMTVRNVRVRSNGGHGIRVSVGGLIHGCFLWNNGGNGLDGNGVCVVTDSVAGHNGFNGFRVADGSSVQGCVASRNDFSGFVGGSGVTFAGCSAFENIGDGFKSASTSTVTGCSAFSNSEDGIDVAYGSTVVNNSCRMNQGDGIEVNSECSVIGNTCTQNGYIVGGGAGVRATQGGNRIEGNTCVNQYFGVNIESAGNIIVRNVCSGSATNWEIVADNYYGPIVSRVGVGTAGVSGDSGASTLGSVDPNANFSY